MKLTVGTIVTIQDVTNDEKHYKSKVVDVGQDYVMIDYPIDVETARASFFMNDTELMVVFTDASKVSYRFFSVVLGRQLAQIPMLKISYPNEESFVKIQRREFVRIDVNVDVAVEYESNMHHLVSADLSAGGLALILPEQHQFHEHRTLNLLFVLPFIQREIAYVRATAKVVRIFEKENQFIASLKFEEISHENRQKVIQYCFERELQLKRKSQ